jgi:hypothetical protein
MRQPTLPENQSLEGDCHASCKEKDNHPKNRCQKKTGSPKENHGT